MATTSRRIALLIDAENADPEHLKTVVEHASRLGGRTTIKRAYGNPTALKKWERALVECHIVPVQTPPSAKKLNASDFALTIEAVALLHNGRYDHLCIMTSDADFTLLAIHIREQGKTVTAFGEENTRAAFRSACDGFVELTRVTAAKPATAVKPVAPAVKKKAPAARVNAISVIDQGKLRSLYDEVAALGKDGVSLGQFGELLSRRGVKRRGHGTLTNFLMKSGLFSVKDDRVMRAQP